MSDATTTKSVEHTPGPWRVVSWATGIDQDIEQRHNVIVIDKSDEKVADTADLLKPWPECEANARLIAAAPDLLEASRHLLAWLQEEEGEDNSADLVDRMLRLQMAIAKAEGRQS